MVSTSLFHQAGQFLRERRQKLLHDFAPYFLVVFAFLIVCLVEWTQRATGNGTTPGFWMLMSILVTVYGGCRVFRLFPRKARTRLDESAERQVAESLDRMQRDDFVVCHNVGEAKSNLDHVVLCPAGVYVIITKAWAGEGIIDYIDNESLIFGGRIRDGLPLRQAREANQALRRALQNELTDVVPVKSLVVIVGEWVVKQAAGDYDVEVIAIDQLEHYFHREQPELTRNEITGIGRCLK